MGKGNEAEAKVPAAKPKGTVPLAERRGISKLLKGGWSALVVHAPGGTGDADALLEFMLQAGWIGGARRDVATELLAGQVPRPVGPWGLVIQLAGHPWLYLSGDGLRYEWVRELAAGLGRRAALFQLSGMHGTLYARAYEGDETLFEFECGGFLADDGRERVRLRKEPFDAAISGKLFDAAWLRQFKRGPEVLEALVHELDLYLPVLGHRSEKGQADLYGRDAAAFKATDYSRIDLIVFGDASTLEPTPAAFALAEAIHAGDAEAVRIAVSQGADVRYLPESDGSPLDAALALGQGGLYDWKYKRISREQQLEVLAALLDAGEQPDPPGEEPAIHRVLHHGEHGNERTVIRQLRLLLDHGADPNAVGTFLRSSGQRPLHVVAMQYGWPAVLKLLLSRGADAALTNAAGKTPRQAAEARLDFLNGPLTMPARGELARLRTAIDLLSAAERGEADLSDIDELAEASWQSWSEEQERKLAARKAENPDLWRELHGED